MDAPSSPGRLSRFAIFLLLGALVLVLAMLGYLKHVEKTHSATIKVHLGHHHHDGAGAEKEASTAKEKAAAASPAASPTPAVKPTAADPAVAQLFRNITDALKVLRDPNNPDKPATLSALRETLAHTDPKVALAAIRQFLATGENADTGQGFRVDEGGVLEQAPTLRTFLMDELGSIGRTAGLADAAEARAMLQASNSPDESALAMRNLAWADPNGSRPTLAAAERAMLNNAAWRASPSGGYLEAFDIAAYAGDASLFEELSSMAATPSPVQRAALVAMQRLSALSPEEVASYLNNHPNILADRPLLRADYMGSVDLSDPAQRAQAETYLSRADVTGEEKEKFIGRLVTPAGFVSNNLLTPPQIAVSIPEHRALVNTVAGEWLASGRYPSLQSALQTAITTTAAAPNSP